MCTAILDFDPDSTVPVLIASLRDEFVDRAWKSPGRNWPGRFPGLVGGRDMEGGGTWLAVAPHQPRVACILNAPGLQVDERSRRSRGFLPLRAAETGDIAGVPLDRFDPFHLVIAEPHSVRLLSWDGTGIASRSLAPGLHTVVNRGLVDDSTLARPQTPRAEHFHPLFEKANRPHPRSEAGCAGMGRVDAARRR